jgi:hypothetical protein
MVKEADEKVKLAVEKAEKLAEERKEKGLPPLEEEDEEVEAIKEKAIVSKEAAATSEEEGKKKGKEFLDSGKPPKAAGALDEIMKIGGEKKERKKPRFASHLGGPNA